MIKQKTDDYLVKALAFNEQVIISTVEATKTVQEITTLHETFPAVSAALGRTVSIGLLMGAMLKGNQKQTIYVAGDGPIGKITVDVTSDLAVRGMVSNPQVHAPSYYSGTENTYGKLNVRGVVGTEGYIRVVKDIGLKESFVGQTELVSGEIAEDFAYYFAKSEQVNSAIAAGVLVEPTNEVSAAGAYMIQLLPNTTEETIIKLEQILKNVRPISEMIADGKTPEEIIEELVGNAFHIVDKRPVRFECTCSKERFTEGISALSTDELEEIVADGEEIETVCHFCNKKYHFAITEIVEIIETRHIRD